MGKGKARHADTYVWLTTPSGTARVMVRTFATSLMAHFPESWGRAMMSPATADDYLSA
jgi:hypothetical protein